MVKQLCEENPLRVWREYGRKLAETAGISAAYLSGIENNEKEDPVAMLKRFTKILRIVV